jgi:predicted DCC family thiol-disulfide oxidoreductase YuxK
MSEKESLARPARRTGEVLLVYDGECPLCHAYCRMVRISEIVGTLRLINARDKSQVMEEITRKGLDIDQGIALKVDDALYYGSQAMWALSMMSSRFGAFNRLNYWIFRSNARSGMLYPALRACRNLLLRILGKTKINNLELPGSQRF